MNSKAERSDFHILELWLECDYFKELQDYADDMMTSSEQAAKIIIEAFFYARNEKNAARAPRLVTQ